MFIEISDPLWIAASFSAQLALEESVKVECVVRRVVPRRGMAVSFEPAGEAEREAVAALLMEIGH